MSIVYRIYGNDGAGGPLDYSIPIGTSSLTSFTTPLLNSPSDNSFGIRTYNTDSGLEEANTNVTVRIVIDSEGNDITSRPNAVHALSSLPGLPGEFLVSWAYVPTGQLIEPTEFVLSLGIGATPTSATFVGLVPYRRGIIAYSFKIAGLSDKTTYTTTVTARAGLDRLMSQPASITLYSDATPSESVDFLTAMQAL